MKKQSFLLDTDIGTDIDDALALIVLTTCMRNRPFAVVTTNGPVRIRAQVAATLLLTLQHKNIPIFRGKSKSLSNTTPFTHGKENFGINKKLKTQKFVDLCHWLKGQNDRSITLIVTAPLTTTAFLLKQSILKKKFSEIVLMGGSLPQRGIPQKEHNFTADPVATRVVLNSGIPIFIVPLNVSIPHKLTQQEIRILNTKHPVLQTWIKAWLDTTQRFSGDDRIFRGKIFLHDPLTVAVAFHKHQCKWEKRAISVDSQGITRVTSGTNVHICTSISSRLVTQAKQILMT